MKIKSILTLTLAAVFLAGCASTQKQMVDGKEREVFVGVVGSWAKDGETLDSFNNVSRPCQQTAIDAQLIIYPTALMPFNTAVKTKFFDAVFEQTEGCLKAAGFIMVKRSDKHSSMAVK